jgi:hypothetical protein
MSDQEPSAESDAAITYDMIRERDHYRARCAAAVERIEREAGKVIDHEGNVVSIVLPVESWRSIRALLQQEPRVLPPARGRT